MYKAVYHHGIIHVAVMCNDRHAHLQCGRSWFDLQLGEGNL
jgi:hypothetical protein